MGSQASFYFFLDQDTDRSDASRRVNSLINIHARGSGRRSKPATRCRGNAIAEKNATTAPGGRSGPA
jgi:hypothetical protein